MSKPNLNPFTTATACQSCPTGRSTSVENAYVECTVPFTPANSAALKTAVTACLQETDDGTCPIFAASNDATGNPYGVIGKWQTGAVTSMYMSK